MGSHILLILVLFLNFCSAKEIQNATTSIKTSKTKFDVGVILNLNTVSGRVVQSCIEMAISDFYTIHAHTIELILHVRNSDGEAVSTLLAALDLIQNFGVQAIISPETSEAAEILAYMGTKAHVPVISFSSETSTSLPFTQFPYFFRIAQSDSSQVKAVAAVIQAFQWKEVLLIHDDSQRGIAAITYLSDALEEIDVVLNSRNVIPHTANETIIKDALRKLFRTSVRVYIVHLSFPLSTHFFIHVNELQMMQAGYVWIITCSLTDLLGYMDYHMLYSMEGVIGVRTHFPRSNALRKFSHRWRKQSRKINHKTKPSEPNGHALWAYDATFLIAMAANKAISRFDLSSGPITGKVTRKGASLFDVDVSPMGSILLQSVLETHFNGLTGDIQLVNGQWQSSTFEIVNIMKRKAQIVGYWTSKAGLSPSLHPEDLEKNYSTNKKDLGIAIRWPGGSMDVPSTAILRIAVPMKAGFVEFVNVSHDLTTNSFIVSGFSREVFDAVMQHLPYHYEYIPFNGSYDNLTQQVSLKLEQKFDAAIGDLTIIANRSKYVDFSSPYSTSGVRMIVRVQNDDFNQNLWWYLKPLTKQLWFTTIALFFSMGLMVWTFEHKINREFQGTISQQIGSALFFTFSILTFSHREKLESNCSRFLVSIWTFAVVVLMACYTAHLTSMLTFKNLKPSGTNLNYLRVHEKFVGYQKGSFVLDLLTDLGFKTKMLKQLSTPEEYADALSRGSENGGVSAIVDEIPHINVFLSKYCHGYTIAGPTYQTGGFGFMFPKHSSLLSDVSQTILELTEGTRMHDLEKKWFGSQTCRVTLAPNVTAPNDLRLYSFRSIPIFMIASFVMSLFFFFAPFIYKSVIDGTLAEKCKAMWQSISAMGQAVPTEELEQNNEAISDSRSDNKEAMSDSRSDNNEAISDSHSDEDANQVGTQQIDSELHSNNTTGQLPEQNDEIATSTDSETVETEVTETSTDSEIVETEFTAATS